MQKILLVLGVAFLQVVIGKFSDADLRPSHRECLQEYNLGSEVIVNNVNEDWTVTEGDPDLNKVSFCSLKKENFFNDDNKLDMDKYRVFLVSDLFVKGNMKFGNPEQVAANVVDACKDVQGSDVGDTVTKHYNCIIKQLAKSN